MPYKNKESYREYMRNYMKNQRKHQAILKRQIMLDRNRILSLQQQFPEIHKLLFGEQKRRRK
jgi:hypothetical protein